MQQQMSWAVATSLGALALLLPVSAPGQLTKDEQKCIDGMNNKARLVSKAQNKEVRACIKNSGKGKEAAAEACLTADPKGKVAKMQSKVQDTFAKKCTGGEPIQQGVTTMNAAHVQGPLDLGHDLFGDPINQSTVTPAEKAAQKCQDKAIQRAGQVFDTQVLEFRKCKKTGMKEGTITTSAELRASCLTPGVPDAKGKIAKKVTKLQADVEKNCGSVAADLGTLFPGLPAGTCHATVADLATCITDRVECRVCQTLNAADGMDRDCDELDNGALDGSCGGGFTQVTCDLAGGGASQIQIFAEAFGATPLALDMSGSIDLASVPADPVTGLAVARCDVNAIDPVTIPAIGVVCIDPAAGCPLGERDCDGGSALGADVLADGDVGACVSNADCVAACDTYCNGLGISYTQASSGCTGYCTEGTEQACDQDADCAGGNGACNGPNGVRTGGNADVCQCVCQDTRAFGDGGAGAFACNLGAELNVESAAPCGDGDVLIPVGETCIPITTQRTDVLITNANFNTCGSPPCMVPPSAASVLGTNLACPVFDGGSASSLKGVGGVAFFGSTLGDLAVTLAATCQ